MARVLLLASDHDGSSRLTRGDLQVFDALRDLDDDWMIAVKPNVGHAPDFLVLHAAFGVCSVLVRDWAVGAFRQGVDGALQALGGAEWFQSSESPRHEALQSRDAIFGEFFAGHGDTVARAIVVMTRFTTAEACSLLRRPHMASDDNWVDVWGGAEFRQHVESALTSDPRLRPKVVPRAALDRLLHHLQFAVALQPA